jgi:hypothetical protein
VGQPGHECHQHGRDGVGRTAEDENEFANPNEPIHESSRTGHEEQDLEKQTAHHTNSRWLIWVCRLISQTRAGIN